MNLEFLKKGWLKYCFQVNLFIGSFFNNLSIKSSKHKFPVFLIILLSLFEFICSINFSSDSPSKGTYLKNRV